MTTVESLVPIGTIYETTNGNVYMRVSEQNSTYLFNRDFARSDKKNYNKVSDSTEVKVLTRFKLSDVMKGNGL